MWQDIAIAVSLVLVIEGIMPFLSPQGWRKMMLNMAQMDDRSIRLVALCTMLTGLALLYWVR